VQSAQAYAVIGPNGAGKSTLLNILTGLVPASSGQIVFDGKDITRTPTSQVVRAGVGRIFQSGRLFLRLSVLENVMLGAAIPADGGRSARGDGWLGRFGVNVHASRHWREESMRMLEQFGLAEIAGREIGALSYGQRRMVELARVMVARPQLLLLDEPAAGLNLGEVERLIERLAALRAAHRLAIVLIEHNMGMVMRLAEWITVLNFGSTLAEGTPAHIQQHPEVLKAYLGLGYQAC
jgi:branched-chain amino acid transport system ATP-binding protein